MTTPTDVRTHLASYISTAYTYEDDFLAHFCEGMDAKELMNCYMGENKSLINVMVPSGTIISHTISTTKFIIWCDTKNGLLTSA